MGHPKQIPLMPQTDEANFPVHNAAAPAGHSGHPWPKMITRPFRKEEREAWLEKNRRIDVTTRQEFYETRCPKVGDPVPLLATQDMVDAGLVPLINEPVIVKNADEEARILKVLGIAPVAVDHPAETFTIPVSGGVPSEGALDRIKRENEQLREQIRERNKLRAEMAADEGDPEEVAPKPRRGKAKAAKPKHGPKRAARSLAEFAADDDD